MPKIGTNKPNPKPKPACKACGGSGKDSRGRPCHPCVQNGRVKT